jgi:uncharacterized protein YggU (UPF0235/DUF167 family)
MYIKIRVTANSKKEIVAENGSRNNKGIADHYKISVREPAKQNLANARILAIFRSKFPNKDVRLISGHHSSSKIISVEI